MDLQVRDYFVISIDFPLPFPPVNRYGVSSSVRLILSRALLLPYCTVGFSMIAMGFLSELASRFYFEADLGGIQDPAWAYEVTLTLVASNGFLMLAVKIAFSRAAVYVSPPPPVLCRLSCRI